MLEELAQRIFIKQWANQFPGYYNTMAIKSKAEVTQTMDSTIKALQHIGCLLMLDHSSN